MRARAEVVAARRRASGVVRVVVAVAVVDEAVVVVVDAVIADLALAATLDPKSSVQMKKLAVTPDTTYSGSA